MGCPKALEVERQNEVSSTVYECLGRTRLGTERLDMLNLQMRRGQIVIVDCKEIQIEHLLAPLDFGSFFEEIF